MKPETQSGIPNPQSAIFIMTLDYELPAGGAGDPRRHMIEPTARLMDVCERHGARLTLMAEMGEIRAFEDPGNAGWRERLGYDAPVEIRAQLVEAVKRGHDVQLHLHPQWLGARWREGRWQLDYDHYALTSLADGAMAEVLRQERRALEDLLCPHAADYACVGIRAGHWTTEPSPRYLAALAAAGLRSDTSVFKGGRAAGPLARYDYRGAHSHFLPWLADPVDINRHHPAGEILEVPIATREATLASLITPKRLNIALKLRAAEREAMPNAECGMRNEHRRGKKGRWASFGKLFSKHPLKFDFCKLTVGQMLSLLKHFIHESSHHSQPTTHNSFPVLAIGHSKQFADGALLRDVDRFLARAVARYASGLRFSTYRQFVFENHAASAAAGEARHASSDKL